MADTSDTKPAESTLPDPQAQPPPPSAAPTSTDNENPSFDQTADHDLDAEINDPTQETTTTLTSDPMITDPPAEGTTNKMPPTQPDTAPPVLPALEPRIPQKKDASLREFLSKTDDYAPIIPDAVTDYYLTLAGLPPPPETDRRLARLLALATQKFIADIAADAYQYSRIRSTNTTSNNPLTGLGGAAGIGVEEKKGGGKEGSGAGGAGGGGKNQALGGPRAGFGGGGGGQGRTVLTMEDLGMAVGEYGVNVKRGEFYR